MAKGQEDNHKLLSDEPILETARTDNLQFGPAAEALAQAALHTDSPMTIGVFGNWGSGKTSLMRLMYEIVDGHGKDQRAAVPVWFNAWQYEREEHLIIPLIATMARDIKKKRDQWEKITLDTEVTDAGKTALKKIMEGGEKVHNALRAVIYGISMKGKLDVPMVGELEITTSMKDMIERYEAVTQDTFMARSLYFDAFDQLRALSHDKEIEKPQIVVFIDDLDRCFPEQAVRLLESVKLILHQPNFAFVLGIYPQIIEEFVRNKYAAQYPVDAIKAASTTDDDELCHRMNDYLKYFNQYLDKIVQVRHYVPERPPEQMQAYIKALLEDAGVASEFLVEGIKEDDLFNLIAEVGRRNPRDIVRKINGLIVKWRIAALEETDEEKQYDLLAGLINEAIADRISRDKQVYVEFLHRLEWVAGSEGGQTYGQALAQALEMTRDAEIYGEQRIIRLRSGTNAEESPTMNSLIEVLRKDEPLCNVLSSEPGRRWLSDKAYREETRETFQEKESPAETRETAKEKKPEPVEREFEVKAVRDLDFEQVLGGMKMVPISSGQFQMGSEHGQDREKPVHTVKLEAFEISATQITQAQYEAVMGTNPSKFKGADRPVERVSWDDARVFCEQLSKKAKGTEQRFTLPTEAQWEYACRAESTSKYCFGDDPKDLDEYGWFDANSENQTQPVGQKKPNKWGLYDMHGNVWEWCLDWFSEDYYSKSPESNPQGPDGGSSRVYRGGSWSSSPQDCRSAYRLFNPPSNRINYLGFRVARSFIGKQAGKAESDT